MERFRVTMKPYTFSSTNSHLRHCSGRFFGIDNSVNRVFGQDSCVFVGLIVWEVPLKLPEPDASF